MNDRCQVWIRSLGLMATRIRVSRVDNAIALHEQLSHSGVTCTQPIELGKDRAFSFEALNVNEMDHLKLVNIIEQLPRFELMIDPA